MALKAPLLWPIKKVAGSGHKISRVRDTESFASYNFENALAFVPVFNFDPNSLLDNKDILISVRLAIPYLS